MGQRERTADDAWGCQEASLVRVAGGSETPVPGACGLPRGAAFCGRLGRAHVVAPAPPLGTVERQSAIRCRYASLLGLIAEREMGLLLAMCLSEGRSVVTRRSDGRDLSATTGSDAHTRVRVWIAALEICA